MDETKVSNCEIVIVSLQASRFCRAIDVAGRHGFAGAGELFGWGSDMYLVISNGPAVACAAAVVRRIPTFTTRAVKSRVHLSTCEYCTQVFCWVDWHQTWGMKYCWSQFVTNELAVRSWPGEAGEFVTTIIHVL